MLFALSLSFLSLFYFFLFFFCIYDILERDSSTRVRSNRY